MPVKLGAKLPNESAEARIEIVPLIDIMFFLLASFMLVSLSMVNLKSVKVNLPIATTATGDSRKGIIDVSVDKAGLMYLDKKRVEDAELVSRLTAARNSKIEPKVFISGDREARHGDVIHVLDLVRSAGIEKVAFEIQKTTEGKQP
jgi:biopolymer transport protein ExbD